MNRYLFLLMFIANNLYSQFDFNYLEIVLYRDGGLVKADLLIEDDQGRKTGVDILTKRIYREIPGTQYGDEGLGDDLSTETATIYNVFSMENPPIGSFFVNIIGLGTDEYKLIFNIERVNTEKLKVEYSGTIGRKEIKKYKLNYNPDPSVPISVEEVTALDPISTIDEMITYINTAVNDSKIDNKGIANSLIAKLETTKKQLEKEKPEQAVNALNAFLNELEAQHEKHISDEVYVYLKEKVTALITQLESSG